MRVKLAVLTGKGAVVDPCEQLMKSPKFRRQDVLWKLRSVVSGILSRKPQATKVIFRDNVVWFPRILGIAVNTVPIG